MSPRVAACKWGASRLEYSVLLSLVLQITEAAPVGVMAPSVVPVIVGEVIVRIVLEQDVSVGPPRTMEMSIGVIATPTRAMLTTAVLATTCPYPSP